MDPARIPPPTPAIPPAARGHTPLISGTPETLPPGQVVRPATLPDAHGPGLDHHVVYLDLDQIAARGIDALEASYQALEGPARPHVWRMLATPDPRLDPEGYMAACWWTHHTIITMGLIRHMEMLGRAYPWPHGHTRGPVLSPSRA